MRENMTSPEEEKGISRAKPCVLGGRREEGNQKRRRKRRVSERQPLEDGAEELWILAGMNAGDASLHDAGSTIWILAR